MSTAEEALQSHREAIADAGQWVAIRRYTGTGSPRPYIEAVTRAFVRYYSSKELLGGIMQNDLTAICLVDTLGSMLPVTTNDKLITGFTGHDVRDVSPPLVDGKTLLGKEHTIKNPLKRTPEGKLIALELHCIG